MLKIIGIDASTKSTGVSFFRNGKLIDRSIIRSSDANVYNRIEAMYVGIKSYVNKYKPDYIFIENVPLANSVNKSVAEHLLVLQGTIYSLAIENNFSFMPMQPSNWRRLAGVKAETRKRESQKKAAIELVESKYGFNCYKWETARIDEKTGDSDVCEAILIGEAGIAYLNEIIEKGNK